MMFGNTLPRLEASFAYRCVFGMAWLSPVHKVDGFECDGNKSVGDLPLRDLSKSAHLPFMSFCHR